MINILVDGNFLAMKTLFGGNNENSCILDTEYECKMFVQNFMLSLSKHGNFSRMSRVIVSFDSPLSWRYSIPIPNGKYKQDRKSKRSQSVNWENFKKCIVDIQNILKQRCIATFLIDNAEGDDILYLLSQYFYHNNEISIIISSDKDLHQTVLTDLSSSNRCIVQYSPNNNYHSLITMEPFNKWLSTFPEVNIFDSSTFSDTERQDMRDVISKLSTNDGFVLKEINPMDYILQKIFVGDRSDSIPSVHTWTSKTGSRTFGVTEKKNELIFESMNTNNIDRSYVLELYENKFLRQEVAKNIKNICTPTNECDVDLISTNIHRNIQLMFLDRKTIPNEIQKSFDGCVESIISTSSFGINAHSILDGSKYQFESDDEYGDDGYILYFKGF